MTFPVLIIPVTRPCKESDCPGGTEPYFPYRTSLSILDAVSCIVSSVYSARDGGSFVVGLFFYYALMPSAIWVILLDPV